MKDIYEQFAYDYDEFGAIDEYLGDERTFFESLFKKHGVKTVLDCACGTGQHLYLFSEMGLDINGSDYSKAMLEVAEKNLKRYGKTIPLRQCDFCSYLYLKRIIYPHFLILGAKKARKG